MKKPLLFTFLLMLLGSILFYKPLLASYAGFFDAAGCTQGADAVLILSGNPETRVERAVALFREGYAKTILLTYTRPMGEKYHDVFKPQNELMEAALVSEGIREFATIPSLKNGATSTFDEAYDAARYAKDHNFSRIILVTDTFHTARALYAFRKIFTLQGAKNVKLEAAGAPNTHFDETNWWQSESGLTHYLLEPLKFGVYWLRASNLESIAEEP
jgi:uncharacterized SAM-binding protein YcdF (DUF218 family)